ncbi:hybrid sensor histidine kinase/response regulator [Pigmentiphaga aceris]|uniref:Chemotaxis protein CheA n=1 Tax=Pigmentiphaga aceris TaxID=1940612 RepID=A0A5C0B100_9BURK|nr:hybrid sensor histidine kinase/response regulator [Pigmentiphaga aceris]QEI06790.1 hybrid sensor histidine kinase/response regulator [Pigmentiphaga aceris]
MNSDQLRDASLLELFQMEAVAQAEVLNGGLLALERDPTSAVHLEACMRAAHSLKGAARIVDLDPGVRIAHVMEDVLVDAQAGRLLLESRHIDVLLQGVDLLLQVGDPVRHMTISIEQVDAYVVALGAVVATPSADTFALPAVDTSMSFLGDLPAIDTVTPFTDLSTPLVPLLPVIPNALASDGYGIPAIPATPAIPVIPATPLAPPPPPVVEEAPEPVLKLPARPGLEDTDDDQDRALRVNARTLNRLVGFAGETLVEAHWLKPFNASVLRLRRNQQGATRAVARVQDLLAERGLDDPRLDAALEEARRLLESCQQGLGERMGELDRFGSRVEHLSQRLYDTALACRMRPFADALPGGTRMVRDLARTLGKQARLEISGETTQVDRDILEALDAPLTHLLRNALDHGVETPAERLAMGKSAEGVLRLHAMHRAGKLLIEVSDDGEGIDLARLRSRIQQRGYANAETAERLSEAELLAFLFLPGFSTRNAVTEFSGRGVGLDVVQTLMRQLRGTARIEQQQGRGTRVVMELPLSLSVVRSLLVDVGGEIYAFPLALVDCTVRVPAEDIVSLEGHQHFAMGNRQIGLVSARQVLQEGNADGHPGDVPVVVIGVDDTAFGVTVDKLLGERTIAIQPLDPRLGKVQDIMAGAVLDDGTPVLVLDVEDLLRSIDKLVSGGRLARVDARQVAPVAHARKHVLVVDDSLTVRELERKLLHNRGYEVSVAVDGMEGWNMLHAGRFDLVVTDVDMPRMDGIELVSRIRAEPRLRAMPVMVVSYKDREEDRRRGLDAGADYYLAKGSFHDDALLDAVADLIGEARS